MSADWRHVQRLDEYEVFCPFVRGHSPQLTRSLTGKLVYAWTHDALSLSQDEQRTLIADGRMKPDEGIWQLRDVDTDRPIEAKLGSVCWNAYRHCWIALMQRMPGAVYYAEADTPVGPWVYASASRSTLALHVLLGRCAAHPEFDADGGRTIYFEGTYTAEFSDAPAKTPRYDYNQLMYRLRLDDPRLALPAPVYRLASGKLCQRSGVIDWSAVVSIEGFAVLPRDTGAAEVSQAELRKSMRRSPISVLPIDGDAKAR